MTEVWYLRHINKYKAPNKGKIHLIKGKQMEQSSLVNYIEKRHNTRHNIQTNI